MSTTSRQQSTSPGNRRRSTPAVAATMVCVLALAAVLTGCGTAAVSSASPTPLVSVVASVASPNATTTIAATPSPTPTPSPSPSPSPKPTPPLPSLLAAIGDSYSQAYSVSPAYLRDHTGFSWVVGATRNDGVFSLYERFRALGVSPSVVDAATSGRQMNDAPRQADVVVAATRKLKPGQTAYVTFELGTNDICADPNPKTDPRVFADELGAAMAILRAGLPAGSRILMLPVPDFAHFGTITQADAAARANLALPQNSDRCPPWLGTNGPFSLSQANEYLASYDAALKAACDSISATDSPSGKLYCTYNATLLGDSDFRIGDLSKVDYFHPSITGQAKMAADAWSTDAWSTIPLPKTAAQ